MDGAPFRPPILGETNYSYCKIEMQVYVQSIDDKALHSIMHAYKIPIAIKKRMYKKNEQMNYYFNSANWNSEALNAISHL